MAFNPNKSSSFGSDVSNYIQKKVLPIAQRQLVFWQFGDKLDMPKEMGTSFTATRFERVPLPQNPLNEGVPSTGESLTITQVQGTCQQWGDLVSVTDVANLTITHPLFKQAINAVALQVSETNERNVINTLMTGTNVYYANKGANRASIGTNVPIPTDLSFIKAKLSNYGSPKYAGPDAQAVGEGADIKLDPRILRKPGPSRPHYVAVINPSIEEDLVTNTTITQAFQYSAIEALYDGEVGQWSGIRFCSSNMIPRYTSGPSVGITESTTGGSIGAVTPYVVVTGVDTQNWFESVIYQEAVGSALTGSTNSLSLTMPSTPGFVYNIYVGTATGAEKLSSSNNDPGAVITVTTIPTTGAAVPPGLGAANDTVIPTFIFGQGSYGIAPLDRTETFLLDKADKSDPQNQLRIVSWKTFYASLILNQNFMIRFESSTNN